MEQMDRLVAVMARLRAPGGCPWDAEQTHRSLAPYCIEETYEFVEAVEVGEPAALAEELGDLLLQVVFHATIAAQEGTFGLEDVARLTADKLIRRHPRVFADDGGADAPTDAAASYAAWDEVKRTEPGRTGVLDGIPAALPAMARAQKVVGRAKRAGLDPADTTGTGAAGRAPASADIEPSATHTPASRAEAEIGAELLALIRRAHDAGLDAEAALRGATRAFEHDIRRAEAADRLA